MSNFEHDVSTYNFIVETLGKMVYKDAPWYKETVERANRIADKHPGKLPRI